jgi:hypothetical protein
LDAGVALFQGRDQLLQKIVFLRPAEPIEPWDDVEYVVGDGLHGEGAHPGVSGFTAGVGDQEQVAEGVAEARRRLAQGQAAAVHHLQGLPITLVEWPSDRTPP